MNNDLEKARAEVARLEALQAPATKAEVQEVIATACSAHKLATEIYRCLGMDREESAGNGSGYYSRRIRELEARLNALEGGARHD